LAEKLNRTGELVATTTRRRDVAGADRPFLDISDAAASADDLPDAAVAFICAGMTRFSDCRAKPELARKTNALGPTAIASGLAARGTRTVFLSTSAVLDCAAPSMRQDRPRSPASAYGRTKAEGEVGVLDASEANAVIRLSKVIPPDFLLLRNWTKVLGERGTISAFTDMTMSPVELETAINAILDVAATGEGGIWHVSARNDISYYDAAMIIAARMKAPRDCIVAATAAQHGIASEDVLAYTSLDCQRLGEATGFVCPDAEAVIGRFLESTLPQTQDCT
jgi:dTDP-4-dehydrorhamnose reductase